MKCYATGDGLSKAMFGQISNFALHAVSISGEALVDLTKYLECKLVSSELASPSNTLFIVYPANPGYYNIKYTPTTTVGTHLLHVKVNGQHIRGSPFRVEVMNPFQPNFGLFYLR